MKISAVVCRSFVRGVGAAGIAVALVAGCTSSECARVAKENPLKVGVYVGAGAQSNGVCYWQKLTTLSPDVEPRFLDEKLIAGGGLDGLDLVVMPGGSSYLEFETLQTTGADQKLKDFIRNGGGYIGTCAGNCMILNGKKRLSISPYVYKANSRGHGTALLAMKFNEKAKERCGIGPKTRLVRYSGGPIMEEGAPVEGAQFDTIAVYDCDLVCEYGTNKNVIASMKGAPAAVCGTYGKGRVFAIATHPEYRADTLDILEGAFRYVSGRKDVRFVRSHRQKGDLSVAVYAPGVMGVADAKMVAELVTTPGLDVTFVNQAEEIGVGCLDHVDALVLPAGRKALYRKKMQRGTREDFARFAARGGKVFAVGTGVEYAPKGTVACASQDEVVRQLKELR